jgi:hypothetical protein
MTTEPFRFNDQVLDVSDMNMASGLRNSLNPLTSTFRLRLSSDLLSSHDVLGRSADGGSTLLGSDGAFGSSPLLMAAHHKALSSSQLATPLSVSFMSTGMAHSSAAGASAALSSLGAQSSREANHSNVNGDVNANGTVRDPYMNMGGRTATGNNGPQPVIQVPSSLQASGPTLSDAMAAGVDAESLRGVQQAALQHSSPSPFNMSQYLQSQTPTTPSGTPISNNNSSSGGGGAGPHGSSSQAANAAQLRFSGDRYASSAFSPVSPGGSSSSQKMPTLPYSPNSTSSGQILSPLSHMTSGASISSSPALQFNLNGGGLPSNSNGNSAPSTPFSPSSHYSSHPQFDALARTSVEMLSNSSGMGSSPNPGPFLSNAGPPPHKRPFLGAQPNDAHHMAQLPPGYRTMDSMSDDSTRTTPNSNGAVFMPEDARSHTLLQSLNTFNHGIALANNAVKQENMIQEHMLGHGVLQGPGSAAFTYQGKAIPYSEEAARQHYMMLEESKKAELVHIQSHLGRVKRTEALANGGDDNFLSEAHLEHRRIKKLHPLTYDALYRSITANIEGIREKYLLNEHPQVITLAELPGRVYFLQVAKGSRKPPHVGFPFRSYSDSHYTSVDRENPVICKVKEWPVDNDPKNIWRLYHYYLGNKKRAPRKRKRADDSDGD